MTYTSPHSEVQEVLSLARQIVDLTTASHYVDDVCEQLRTALAALDTDSASESDVQTAKEMYEGPDGEKDIQVDPRGYALASRGDDGVWVSAWVLIRTTPT